MGFIKWTLIVVVSIIFGIFSAIYYLGGSGDFSAPDTARSTSNYNSTYTINLNDKRCGELGYHFMLTHQKLGYSKTGSMNKSNCRKDSAGNLEGYIYPEKMPNLKIFWVEKDGVPAFKE